MLESHKSVFSYSHMLVNICRLSELLWKSAQKGLPETKQQGGCSAQGIINSVTGITWCRHSWNTSAKQKECQTFKSPGTRFLAVTAAVGDIETEDWEETDSTTRRDPCVQQVPQISTHQQELGQKQVTLFGKTES